MVENLRAHDNIKEWGGELDAFIQARPSYGTCDLNGQLYRLRSKVTFTRRHSNVSGNGSGEIREGHGVDITTTLPKHGPKPPRLGQFP